MGFKPPVGTVLPDVMEMHEKFPIRIGVAVFDALHRRG
jgi:hypothetical protein